MNLPSGALIVDKDSYGEESLRGGDV